MILPKLQYSFVPERAELSGHRAAVNAQIVGELLAVKRDIEFIFSAFRRLRGQIGKQLFARRALAHVAELRVEIKIFARELVY